MIRRRCYKTSVSSVCDILIKHIMIICFWLSICWERDTLYILHHCLCHLRFHVKVNRKYKRVIRIDTYFVEMVCASWVNGIGARDIRNDNHGLHGATWNTIFLYIVGAVMTPLSIHSQPDNPHRNITHLGRYYQIRLLPNTIWHYALMQMYVSTTECF